jgi:hypothetical protein
MSQISASASVARVDTVDVRVTDSGGDGRPIENDPIVALTVWVGAEAGWLIDKFIELLPPPFSFAGQINATTCAIGSPEFINLGPIESRQRVENMLRNIVALMHIYSPNSPRYFEVLQVHEQHASGRQSVVARFTIPINKADGHAALTKPVGTESRAKLILRLAETDSQVKEALGLVQAAEPGWGAVYDVLQFIKHSAAAQKHKTKIALFIRTANWYRHLGERRKPLPDKAPTLEVAREFAFDFLQEWLDRRLQQASPARQHPTP